MTAIHTATEPALETPPARSMWWYARRRFRRNVLAIVGLVGITLLVLLCYGLLPWALYAPAPAVDGAVPPPRYLDQVLAAKLTPPGPEHLMGTDRLGRSLMARFAVGGAISLAIGLASAAIAVGIGVTVGMVAGYAGGRTDAFLMRIVDVLYGLPYILLVILMRVSLVPVLKNVLDGDGGSNAVVRSPEVWANVIVLLVGIGAVSWLTMARVVRGQVLSLRDQPFVEAARAMGLGNSAILFRHILPNLVGPILVYATLTVPAAILSESFLSFLGLGIQEPLPSWGNLAADGVAAFNPVQAHWWLLVFPCAGLSLALLCLNFLGDGLRDALDPKGR